MKKLSARAPEFIPSTKIKLSTNVLEFIPSSLTNKSLITNNNASTSKSLIINRKKR